MKSLPKFFYPLFAALLVVIFIISGCSKASPSTTMPVPTSTPETFISVEPTKKADSVGSINISFDYSNAATGYAIDTVAAVSSNENAPYWEILPEYTKLTLEGYRITSHLLQPQIFIFPIDPIEDINDNACQNVALLQSLLQSPQEIETMPFLPLFNARQAMHSQVQYLDFEDGQGLRYLAWFSQGIVPVNNNELFYTFQGITSDGNYYVSAILPVTHPSLPMDGIISGDEPSEFTDNYSAYLDNVAANLNTQAGSTFLPDLSLLDDMMSSLDIN